MDKQKKKKMEKKNYCQEKMREKERDQTRSSGKRKMGVRERKTEKGNTLIVVYFHILQMFLSYQPLLFTASSQLLQVTEPEPELISRMLV